MFVISYKHGYQGAHSEYAIDCLLGVVVLSMCRVPAIMVSLSFVYVKYERFRK